MRTPHRPHHVTTEGVWPRVSALGVWLCAACGTVLLLVAPAAGETPRSPSSRRAQRSSSRPGQRLGTTTRRAFVVRRPAKRPSRPARRPVGLSRASGKPVVRRPTKVALGSRPKVVIRKGMARIAAGSYLPLFSKGRKEVKVSAFWLDVRPVTNAQFLSFVRAHPRWRRSRIKRIFADEAYLKHWGGDLSLGAHAARLAKSPVVHVSWFPAKYYCRSLGKRLPTVAEWEYVAAASKTRRLGRDEPGYNQRILRWYSKPTPRFLPQVGSTFRNVWGVFDMHGLIWEWVLDFNTALVTGDSRGDSALNNKLFCGSGAVGASDFKNYAAFMRYAYRSSLQVNYNTANLGFRCARNAKRAKGEGLQRQASSIRKVTKR